MNKKKNPWVLYTSILLLALSLLFGVFWCLYVYVIGPLIEEAEKISIPTSDIPWKWILVIVAGLLIIWLVWYFWEVISKKTYGVKQKIVTAWTSRPKKFPTWARWFVGLAITGVILWFLWPSIGLQFYFGGSSSPSASTRATKPIYARLDTAGSNIMPQGVYRTFTISDKGPAANLFFTPQSSGIYQYHFKWMGDTTRQWTLLNEFDTNGVCIRDTLLSPMPYDEALIGEVAVCVTNRNDAVVVVERKEIVH